MICQSTAIELVGPSWRTHVALLANVIYSLTLCLLGVVVWLVRDWRQMSLATSLPFLAYFLYWWYVTREAVRLCLEIISLRTFPMVIGCCRNPPDGSFHRTG